MHTEPKLDNRTEQTYVGVRAVTPPSDLDVVIPRLLDQVEIWLSQKGIVPTGSPFIRYYSLGETFDIEIGFPVAAGMTGDETVKVDTLPAGRYASLVYTGIDNGYPANKALVEWAEANGIDWDHWDTPQGDAFRSRYEIFITDPEDEPDRDKWETEVAIRLADA